MDHIDTSLLEKDLMFLRSKKKEITQIYNRLYSLITFCNFGPFKEELDQTNPPKIATKRLKSYISGELLTDQNLIQTLNDDKLFDTSCKKRVVQWIVSDIYTKCPYCDEDKQGIIQKMDITYKIILWCIEKEHEMFGEWTKYDLLFAHIFMCCIDDGMQYDHRLPVWKAAWPMHHNLDVFKSLYGVAYRLYIIYYILYIIYYIIV